MSTGVVVAPGASSGFRRGPFAMVTLLFFAWGFLTVLNDILIPHFKNIFSLDYAHVMLTQFTFFAGYVVMALPAGWLTGRVGYRLSMVAGLSVMGIGALCFLPAASLFSYPLFLSALFVLSSGMTILQVACNPYVTVLGPAETASSRLNLAQAFNSLGATLAPWLGGLLILSGTKALPEWSAAQLGAFRLREAAAVQGPYLVFAAVLFVLALLVSRFKWPEIGAASSHRRTGIVTNGKTITSAWKVRHLVLGALGILLYCGAEVSIGSFLVNFFAEPSIAGFSEKVGARYASYYWMGAMFGRFAGFALLRNFPAGKLLGIFGIAASTLVWVCVLATGPVSLWAIIAVGLFNSIMFPTIFSLAIDGLGDLTSQGSGILLLGVIGPAVLPVLEGMLADRFGVQTAFVMPALCYLYVVYYGFWGSRHAPCAAAHPNDPAKDH